MSFKVTGICMALYLCAAAHGAAAQEAFTGAWEVTKTEKAPWIVKDPAIKAEVEPALAHAHITFGKDRITAPLWLGCKSPTYDVSPMPFNFLFEGGLEDKEHGLNDAKGLALKLGFTKEPVISMQASCSEMLFHLADKDTAMFALNNVIYTMKRRP